MKYQLAQANVAYALVPTDHPQIAEYIARLDEMNSLAERCPGFVWRYVTDSRDPHQREFADPLVLFNMSVWTDIDALHHYTYATAHAEVYAARKKWFADVKAVVGGHALALWWIPEATLPTVEDAKMKMHLIAEQGPTEQAFSLKKRFPPPLG